jgi:hydroxymethylglutaryl-CoA synthase
MDIYFPRNFCAQEDLERFDNIPKGKYTVGLGQESLAFVDDSEDIYSMALTAVANLVEKYGISYKDIGRLEVATETVLDHSKAIKTVLMQLFEKSGNTDVEGVDTINACYAGTNALFNSLAWMESSAWDGRYALVLAGDIAEYAPGPARPTGGAGAVAFLIGPKAPLVMERGLRASHMEHAYDFYKPNLNSPYPVVDGKFSNICYLRALDTCYQRFADKFETRTGSAFDMTKVDHMAFHTPYNKLVVKSFGRIAYNDYMRNPNRAEFAAIKQQFGGLTTEQSYSDGALEKALVGLTAKDYKTKVEPSQLLSKQLGNMYTASLYAGLLSLVHQRNENLAGNRILMFSYGSGLAASLFSLRVPSTDYAKAALLNIRDKANLDQRLADRKRIEPEVFSKTMQIRENLHHSNIGYQPQGPIQPLFPGTFWLTKKDDLGRRFYDRAP